MLQETINLSGLQVDPAPFQLVESTNLHKVHTLFALLGLTHTYVTAIGRLVGVVTLDDVSHIVLGLFFSICPKSFVVCCFVMLFLSMLLLLLSLFETADSGC